MMSIPKLSPQTAQAVLEYALETGLLTESQVSEAILNQPTAEQMRMASLLHVIACREEHDEGSCLFYFEEQDEATPRVIWQRKFHKLWLERVSVYMNSLNLSDETQFNRALQSARDLNQTLEQKKESDLNAYALFLLIRGWED